jgi:hypothetical protein
MGTGRFMDRCEEKLREHKILLIGMNSPKKNISGQKSPYPGKGSCMVRK